MDKKSVAISIRRANIELEKIGNQLLEPYNITYAQFKVMKYLLANSSEMVRQVDIERYFSLTNPTVTGIINQLEKKAFVKRKQNPEDARSKLVDLTEKAYAMEKDVSELGLAIERAITEKLNAEECATLYQLLEKMLEETN